MVSHRPDGVEPEEHDERDDEEAQGPDFAARAHVDGELREDDEREEGAERVDDQVDE